MPGSTPARLKTIGPGGADGPAVVVVSDDGVDASLVASDPEHAPRTLTPISTSSSRRFAPCRAPVADSISNPSRPHSPEQIDA
jgi:hypothetical protein